EGRLETPTESECLVETRGEGDRRVIPDRPAHPHHAVDGLGDTVRLDFRVAGVEDHTPDVILEYREGPLQRPRGPGLTLTVCILKDNLPGLTPVPAEVNDVGLVVEQVPLKVDNPHGLLPLDDELIPQVGQPEPLLDRPDL